MFRPGPTGAPASTWVDNPTTPSEEKNRNYNVPKSVGKGRGGDYETIVEQQDWMKTSAEDGDNGAISFEKRELDGGQGEGVSDEGACPEELDDPDDITVTCIGHGDPNYWEDTSTDSME